MVYRKNNFSNRSFWITFSVGAVFIVVWSWSFGFPFFPPAISPTPVLTVEGHSSGDLQRLDLKLGDVVSASFFENVPLFPKAVTIENWGLFNPQIGNKVLIESGLILTSASTPAEVQGFYRSKLLLPSFALVPKSDQADTAASKTLVYSIGHGLLVIKIEARGNGSKITLRDINMLIQPLPSPNS